MRLSFLGGAVLVAGAIMTPGTTPAHAQQPVPPVPPAAVPRAPAMPAVPAPTIPPVNLVPSFIQKGKVYAFVIVRKEHKGEVIDIDRTGWVRVDFVEDDDEFADLPWLNLNHVTLILPESTDVKPVKK